jgi:hypothetical protein
VHDDLDPSTPTPADDLGDPAGVLAALDEDGATWNERAPRAIGHPGLGDWPEIHASR